MTVVESASRSDGVPGRRLDQAQAACSCSSHAVWLFPGAACWLAPCRKGEEGAAGVERAVTSRTKRTLVAFA